MQAKRRDPRHACDFLLQSDGQHMGVSINGGTPKWMVREIPFKWHLTKPVDFLQDALNILLEPQVQQPKFGNPVNHRAKAILGAGSEFS